MKRKKILTIFFVFLLSVVHANAELTDDKFVGDIADHYLVAYLDMKYSKQYLPIELFTEELELAQEYVESGGDSEAVSKKRAVGVMQTVESSIKDVCGYKLSQADVDALSEDKRNFHLEEKKKGRRGLDRIGYIYKLSKRGVVNFDGPPMVNRVELNHIMSKLTNRDFSIAFSRLYLMQLFDDLDGYGVGREEYDNGDIERAQILLMAVYNGGKRRIAGKPKVEWPAESFRYAKKVMRNMTRVKEIIASNDVLTIKKIFKMLERYA